MTISTFTGKSGGLFSLGVVGEIFSTAGNALAEVTKAWAESVEDDKPITAAQREVNRGEKAEVVADAQVDLRIRQLKGARTRQLRELEAKLELEKTNLDIAIAQCKDAKLGVMRTKGLTPTEKLALVDKLDAELQQQIKLYTLILGDVKTSKELSNPSLELDNDFAEFANVVDDQPTTL